MKIFVTVKTKSKNTNVEKTDDSNFIVSVKELPIDGKANRAVMNALAEYFKVAKSQINLVSGSSSKKKIFEIIY